MPYQILKNTDGSYAVVNPLTKQFHSKHTTLQKAKSQIRLLHMVTGDGLFDTVKSFIYGRFDYSPRVKKILYHIGNTRIHKMVIGRTPLSIITSGAIRLLSNKSFDKLFHLFILINDTIMIEKNEVINITITTDIPRGTEIFVIGSVPNITINQLLNNTKDFMKKDYFPYSAKNNNCQDFILSILKANHITEGHSFVKQDVEYIFNNNHNLRKFINTITDIAGRFDVLKQGGANRIRLNGLTNGLYSNELISILKDHGRNINGVYSKDLLPTRLKKGWYIINLQNSSGLGSHWTCFYYDNGLIHYFDAFAGPPVNEVMRHATKGLSYNAVVIQNMNSSCCGWYCIGCIISNDIKKFVSIFNQVHTEKNDCILKKFIETH